MLKHVVTEGERFGRLITVSRVDDYISPKGKHQKRWKCICDCGNETVALASHLNQGQKTSCGCKVKEIASALHKTHNESRSRLYDIWHTMKQRCQNPNAHAYERYGDKNITVCSEWLDYKTFAQWARSNGYADDLTLDRVDGTKGYCPENCRWVTYKEQARNRKSNHLIIFQDKEMTISEFCELTGISRHTVYDGLKNNMTPEEISEVHA